MLATSIEESTKHQSGVYVCPSVCPSHFSLTLMQLLGCVLLVIHQWVVNAVWVTKGVIHLPNRTETGFGFSVFFHSICQT